MRSASSRLRSRSPRTGCATGLPLRAELPVVGYVARRPGPTPAGPPTGHLGVEPDPGPDVERFHQQCADAVGFVMNVARVWSRLPEQHDQLFALLDDVARVAGLTFRQRGILVTACAARLGDSYSALAWGRKLAVHSGPDVPVSVLRGSDEALSEPERALAAWAPPRRGRALRDRSRRHRPTARRRLRRHPDPGDHVVRRAAHRLLDRQRRPRHPARPRVRRRRPGPRRGHVRPADRELSVTAAERPRRDRASSAAVTLQWARG